jgi:hypothetical protein
MNHRVHAGNHGGQHLRGADVELAFSRLCLLAGLQRQTVGRVAAVTSTLTLTSRPGSLDARLVAAGG